MRAVLVLLTLAACASTPRAVEAPQPPPPAPAATFAPCPEVARLAEAPAPAAVPTVVEPDPPAPTFRGGPGGAVSGTVKDKAGKTLSGVTVVATSPVLRGTQAELSDAKGRYLIDSLPRGSYVIAFYFAEIVLERKNIDVREGKLTSVNQTIDTTASGGETITITEKVGTIDVKPAGWCAELNTNCGYDLPLPGRTFEGALSSARTVKHPTVSPCR